VKLAIVVTLIGVALIFDYITEPRRPPRKRYTDVTRRPAGFR
jgi:hypothetical protein